MPGIYYCVLFLFQIELFAQQDLYTAFGSTQVVTVETSGSSATKGTLRFFEYSNGNWKKVLDAIPVIVGRHGLAWGNGLHPDFLVKGEFKREGDGKSPMGIFYINSAFGYEPVEIKLDYLQVDSTCFCIDDPSSIYYNSIVDTDMVTPDWNSAEEMRRQDNQYKFGLVVGYPGNPGKGGENGSCIFLHLWKDKSSFTAGCTAMSEKDFLKLLFVLDSKRKPLLIQGTMEAFLKMQAAYRIP